MEGFISKKFTLHKTVRQGRPLPLLLFNLVIEALVTRVHQNQGIKGIETSLNTHKVILYIDDVVFTKSVGIYTGIEYGVETIWGGLRI